MAEVIGMADVVRTSKVKMASIEIKVTRKDGTVENLGTVSYYHRNPLKRLWWWYNQNFGFWRKKG